MIIASLDDQYVKYIRSESEAAEKPESFMSVTQFGPFAVRDKAQMEIFGTFVLAFSETGCVKPRAVPDDNDEVRGTKRKASD